MRKADNGKKGKGRAKKSPSFVSSSRLAGKRLFFFLKGIALGLGGWVLARAQCSYPLKKKEGKAAAKRRRGRAAAEWIASFGSIKGPSK